MLECHWWNSGQRRRSPCDTFESPSDGNPSPCDGIAKVLMTFRPTDYVPIFRCNRFFGGLLTEMSMTTEINHH